MIRASALAALTLALTGCVLGAPSGAVRPAAPPPLPEWKTGPAAPGLVWIAGGWHWDGAAWVWLPGHWESPPPAALGR